MSYASCSSSSLLATVIPVQMQACLGLSAETGLSEAREELLQEAIATARAAREARPRDISESVHAMNALWQVLGSDEDSREDGVDT